MSMCGLTSASIGAGVNGIAPCSSGDEDRFNNAFFLLKKTVDFLTSEYDMHFVILSAYQSNKSQAVSTAYTSPGPAATFFDDTSSESLLLSSKNSASIPKNSNSSLKTSNHTGNILFQKWDKFAKNVCLQGTTSHLLSNLPSYSKVVKSDINENTCLPVSSSNTLDMFTNVTNCGNANNNSNDNEKASLLPPHPTPLDLPEPPTKLLSETMYYCNGEFIGEDTENNEGAGRHSTTNANKDGSINAKQEGRRGVKRKSKSLQVVSEQLAKKASAVAVNYYRPIYPAAPKVVTPSSVPTACDSVLNLSNSLRNGGSNSNGALNLKVEPPHQTGNELHNTAASNINPLLASVSALLASSTYNRTANPVTAATIKQNNTRSTIPSPPSAVSRKVSNTNTGTADMKNGNSGGNIQSSISAAIDCSYRSSNMSPALLKGKDLTIKCSTSPVKSETTSNGKEKESKKNGASARAPPSPMKSSMFNANGTPKQMWPCTVCAKEFASQSTMKRHLNHFHLKVHSYTCSYCQEVFYRKDKLVSHIKTKHGIDTSRSARLLTQTQTSPNGSTTMNSTLSPVSPSDSTNSSGTTTDSSSNNNNNNNNTCSYNSIHSPVPSPSPNSIKHECNRNSPVPSPYLNGLKRDCNMNSSQLGAGYSSPSPTQNHSTSSCSSPPSESSPIPLTTSATPIAAAVAAN